MVNQQGFGALFMEPFAGSIHEGRMSVLDASAKCKAMRDEEARRLKSEGRNVRKWTLSNQMKPYWGLGDPCGMICNVYMIDVS